MDMNSSSSKKRLLLALTAFVSVFMIYQILRNISDLTADLDCFISAKNRRSLLGIFRSFQKAVDKHRARCWLNFGGLIGVYRYENLLPWDKDLDIACLQKDEGILNGSVLAELKKMGISAKYVDGKHYFRLQQDTEIWGKEEATLDVKMFKQCNECTAEFHPNCKNCQTPDDLVRLNTPDDWKWWMMGKTENFKKDWVFPLRACKLAHIETKCPRKMEIYLRAAYPKSFDSGLNVPYKLDCWLRFWQALKIIKGCEGCHAS